MTRIFLDDWPLNMREVGEIALQRLLPGAIVVAGCCGLSLEDDEVGSGVDFAGG